MTDKLSKMKRSWNMSRIKSKDTKPEIKVRSLLHKNGFRFRLQNKDLPGKPDIVLKKYNTIIFVHGCFWHLHENCKDSNIPKTNTEFWEKKLSKNKERDLKVQGELLQIGWNVMVIWECELNNQNILLKKILSLKKSAD